MNIIEEYLAKAANKNKVNPGDDISVNVDLVIAHDVTAPMAIDQFEKIGANGVFDPKKVVFVLDHLMPAATVEARQLHNKIKDFSNSNNTCIFNHGEGVIHQVVAENEFVGRGDIIIGADSHTCTAGAYGAIAIPIGSTDLAATMATGKIDIVVPPVDQLYLNNRPDETVSAKDIILNLIGRFGTDGFNDRGIVFSGEGFAELSVEEKMTITNMCIEMGAMIAYMATSKEKIGEVDRVFEFEAEDFSQVMACPHSPGNVEDISKIKGKNINQVVIGSCTNGRISDMRIAAEVLKGKQINKEVTLIVVPASKNVIDKMEEEGLTKIFRDAGAIVTNAGCGPCFGAHMGLASSDDVVVSTTNRNFPGRMGDNEAQVYLASPGAAARSAVQGKIAEY
ncbi:MAG: aconitase/3-isopropylmalate dehydratase large subunit family protein [Bacillota bacterium]